MVRRIKIRERGKIQLSRFFQKLSIGDSVAVVRQRSLDAKFPQRLQGRTGVVIGQRGSSYIVKIKDQAKPKEFIIKPIHLKKIQRIQSND